MTPRRIPYWCLLMAASLSTILLSQAGLINADQTQNESPEHFLEQGDSLLMKDALEEAISVYEKGIALLAPNDPLLVAMSLYTNLGTAQYAFGRLEDALLSYQTSLLEYNTNKKDNTDEQIKADLDAVAASAAFYLGMVYQDQQAAQDAIDAYLFAIQLDPLYWSAYANLGSVYQDLLVQHEKALQAYNHAFNLLFNVDKIQPTDAPTEPRFILSQLQYRIGICIQHYIESGRSCAVEDEPTKAIDCKELATNAFSLSIEYDASNEAAKHMLATLTADAGMKRASNTYVKSLFDDYAKNFEHSLVQELGYTGYERLRRGFDRAFDDKPPVFDIVIDAGCGTGLVGEQFRNISKHLTGVDLSQAIINEALSTRPKLYDDTVAGDIMEVFRERSPVSLIIAADSYIYFGDLDPLFEAMADGLGVGSYAAFTLENVDIANEKLLSESTPDWRWQLTPSGRFAHRQSYVEAVCKSHSLEVIHYEPLIDFRYERGAGVRGHTFVVQKVGSRDEL
jgi:predicted TPR repeat methyltransferase